MQQERPSTSRSGRAASTHTVLSFQNVHVKGPKVSFKVTSSSDLKAAIEKTVEELENRLGNVMSNVTQHSKESDVIKMSSGQCSVPARGHCYPYGEHEMTIPIKWYREL